MSQSNANSAEQSTIVYGSGRKTDAPIPRPGMELRQGRAAIVVTDPHDHKWRFEGALERLMHDINMFERPGALDLNQFAESGADWLEQYKPFINDGETVVCSPHKVFGPQSNDLVLQLRKRGIEQVILAGMSANLCVESHLRELLEQGFEVAVVGDATAAAQVPGFDGYDAAITNFRFLASDLWSAEEAVEKLQPSQGCGDACHTMAADAVGATT